MRARRTAPCTPRPGSGCARCRAPQTCCGRRKTRGLAVVVASSADEPGLHTLRAALDAEDAIDATLSPGDVESSKSAPDLVQVALERVGVPAEEAVFTGDTVCDVRACRKAEGPCIGLLSGGISGHELTAAGAAEVYPRLADLLSALRGSLLCRRERSSCSRKPETRPSSPGIRNGRGRTRRQRAPTACRRVRVVGDRVCRLDSVGAGQRSGTDDLLRSPDPEFFEQVCLAPRPGNELVEVPGVQPPVGVRERPQGTPACCLAFYA
jgi:Haloacid dehalogenase-like hydrolase